MTSRLLVFSFGPEGSYEGLLLGALERLDAGGTVRVRDALFVKADDGPGAPSVFDGRGQGLGAMLVSAIDFRLDPVARARASDDALAADSAGVPEATLWAMSDALPPGGALAAVLLDQPAGEPVDLEVLDDAVARAGGAAVVSKPVEAAELAEVADDLRAAARLG